MAEFRMPALGADMDSGILTTWLVAPGDTVARGDIVASVETSKGIIDIEIFEGGVIESLIVSPGVEVAVGAPLATYRPAAGDTRVAGLAPTPAERAAGPPRAAAATLLPAEPSAPPPPAEPTTTRAPPAAAAARAQPAAAAAPFERRAVSPAARRRAAELSIEAEALDGTGPGGAVTVADVERAAAAEGAAAVGEGVREAGRVRAEPPLPRAAEPAAKPTAVADMRAIIGRAMSRSKREIPHYYLATTIDMTRALRWLESWNATHAVPERLLPGALLIKATALALEKFPELNGFVLDGRFEPSPDINVGVAIRLRQGGVIAPGIDAANTATLPALMAALKSLVQRARAGRLKRTEITNATITVSSLGEGGVETLFPIVYPPQVAIVGFGSIVERPWVTDGTVVAAPVLTATLSADHRVSDGHRGSVFLKDIEERLQHPENL